MASPGQLGRSTSAVPRLAVALGLTMLLAPCAVVGLAWRLRLPVFAPPWAVLIAWIVLSVSIMALARRASPGRPVPALPMLSLAVFGLVLAVVLYVFTGTRVPRWQTIPILLSASLWAYWFAWGRQWLPSGLAYLAAGGVLLAWGYGFPAVLRFDGLTGDARADFAWNWSKPAWTAARPASASAAQGQLPFERQTAAESPRPTERQTPAEPLDFPEFLGNRQARLAERPLNANWQAAPPELLWRRPVGAGWCSFALVGDQAVTMEQRDEHECVVCYRLGTGDEMWSHAEPAHFTSVLGGDGPRATPTVDAGRVYAVGATGIATCTSLASGQLLWKVDLFADNGGAPIHHGMCGSPLVVGDLVVVTVTGTSRAALVAYDKQTGSRRWQAGKWSASYSSPQLATLLGQPQILSYHQRGVEAHDIASGQLLWSFEWTNNETTVCSQPVLVPERDDQLLLSVGYNQGAVLVELSRGADGAWQAASRWTSRDLKTKFTTAVYHDGFFYGLDNGILACISAETGQRRWKQGRYQHGQVLLVGDLLLVQAESGDVVLVRATPQELVELGSIPALARKTWNHPALAHELLVVRNDQEAACYRIGKP